MKWVILVGSLRYKWPGIHVANKFGVNAIVMCKMLPLTGWNVWFVCFSFLGRKCSFDLLVYWQQTVAPLQCHCEHFTFPSILHPYPPDIHCVGLERSEDEYWMFYMCHRNDSSVFRSFKTDVIQLRLSKAEINWKFEINSSLIVPQF